MAHHTVKDENDFGEDGDYIRIALKPTTMMHGRSGEVFVRADGKDWPISAYTIKTKYNRDGSVTVDRGPATTWSDPYRE